MSNLIYKTIFFFFNFFYSDYEGWLKNNRTILIKSKKNNFLICNFYSSSKYSLLTLITSFKWFFHCRKHLSYSFFVCFQARPSIFVSPPVCPQIVFLSSLPSSEGTKRNHRRPSQVSEVDEEVASLSFLSKIHAQRRQCELKRYRDGRTSHHFATNVKCEMWHFSQTFSRKRLETPRMV